jgi:hypothetical protein
MHDGMQCWGPEPCVAVGDHRRATFHDLALREAARGGHLPSPDPLLGYLRMDLRWPSPRADLAQASRVYLEAEYRMDWRRPDWLYIPAYLEAEKWAPFKLTFGKVYLHPGVS